MSKRERFFVPWADFSLGVGQTRCFLKMTNRLPKLLHATGRLDFFPQVGLMASFVQHLPLCPFDFYGTCAFLPLVPAPIRYEAVEGLFLSIMLLAFHMLSVRTSLCCHLG